jgi:ferredoxin-thioredoxin reductase catalytic subunit/rubredoxin
MSDVDALYEKLKREAERRGYRLNPDEAFVKSLIEGLATNGARYGYESCPCRLSTGKKDMDMDIVCPCDYRDSDINKYGACYCGLYVSEKVFKGEQALSSIPESRAPAELRVKADGAGAVVPRGSYPVWRCKVCGYLCARDSPPDKCPICNVSKERFERFS